MDKESYHSGTSRLSSSGAKELLRSPKHFQLKYGRQSIKQKPSPAMAFGTAVHTLVLEGEEAFKASIVADPGINRRTKAGKFEWEELMARYPNVPPHMVFKAKDIDTMYFLRDAVFDHPVAAELLSEGKPEQYYDWTDPETGAPCKALADWLKPDAIVDLKTCADASPVGFGKAVYNFKYHLSAEFYRMGFEANNAGVVPQWYWIAAEKETCQVAVYTPDEIASSLGRAQCVEAMRIFAECHRTGRWDSYPNTAQELVSPAWAR